jgi:hypothetical protein
VVGLLTVPASEGQPAQDFVIKPGQQIEAPGTGLTIDILEYIPHYSIDSETKKITNLSNRPVNPAVRVAISDGLNKAERWLWAEFPEFIHDHAHGHALADPLKSVELIFTHYDMGENPPHYVILTAPSARPWLLFARDGKAKVESLEIGRAYPLARDYVFVVEEFMAEAVLKDTWHNGSEQLRHPAVVAVFEDGPRKEQMVLELGKPSHLKVKDETLAVLFRLEQTQPATAR